MNRPMYVPPKLKKVLRIINESIEARLKLANTAPTIDTQFLIDEGSFMSNYLIKIKYLIDSASLQKVGNNS